MPRSDPISLEGRRVLLTGGTGFLGRSLLDYALESAQQCGSGFEITILSRDPEHFLARFPCYSDHGFLRFVGGSLLDLPASIGKVTDVVHLAADTHFEGSALQWMDQIVGGTRSVLDFARVHCSGRFLLASSGAVYGDQQIGDPPWDESTHSAPLTTRRQTTYAQCKRLAEHMCEIYRHDVGVETVIARYFAVLSGHMPLNGPYAAGNFLRDAMFGERIAVNGDGSALRTYIDGRDMAHWTFAILTRGAVGEAYNVGSDQAVSIAELARMFANLLCPEKQVSFRGPEESAGRSIYLPSIAKSTRLGLSVETGLPESILGAARAVRAAGMSRGQR